MYVFLSLSLYIGGTLKQARIDMALNFESEVPPKSGIDYHMLPSHDPRVLGRVKVWVKDEVVFCREACNFYPHWYQESLLRDKSLFIAAGWSRQTGKSQAVAYKAIHHVFTHTDSVVVIIAPGQRQAKELYKKVVDIIQMSPLIKSSVVGKIKMEETLFANGSRIINLPSGDEGTALRGYTIGLLIIDEAAFVPDAVFVAVEQGLSSSGGQQLCISTPRGKHNEFYRMFFPEDQNIGFPREEDGRLTNGHHQVGDWSCHHYDYTVGLAVTRPDGRPQLSTPHIERQKRRLTGWQWESEYMAEFVEDLGSYFRAQLIERMFNPKFGRVHYPEDGALYFMGIDIAKSRDYTAITVGRVFERNPYTAAPLLHPHMQIVNMDYYKGMGDIESQYPIFVQATDLWKPETIFFDKTAMGERPYEELRYTYRLPIEGINFGQQNKVQMFGTLNTLMSTPAEIDGWDARIQSYVDQEAAKQFKNLVYELGTTRTSVGSTRKSDNVKIYASHGHDDIPMSFALLMLSLSGHMIKAPIATITKEYDQRRMIKQRNMLSGFSRGPGVGVKGFGQRPGRRRNKKVFW